MHVHNEVLKSEISEAWQQKDTKKLFEIELKAIESNTSGFTRDLLVTKFFAAEKKGWPDYFDSTAVKNPYFKSIIHNLQVKNQHELTNEYVDILSIRDECNAHIIDKIINEGKGKVLYLDFWAPWCKPCLKEMPYLNEMHKFLDPNQIEFVYLCCNSSEEASRGIIERYDIKGIHINLSIAEFDNLFSKLGLTGGIPAYVIINSKGEIVSTKPPLPSNIEELKVTIEKITTTSHNKR